DLLRSVPHHGALVNKLECLILLVIVAILAFAAFGPTGCERAPIGNCPSYERCVEDSERYPDASPGVTPSEADSFRSPRSAKLPLTCRGHFSIAYAAQSCLWFRQPPGSAKLHESEAPLLTCRSKKVTPGVAYLRGRNFGRNFTSILAYS
ncbi:hypothetical protein LCGC14_1036300, partial [marine sediment metagenome]